MFSSILLAAAALTSLVSAQNYSTSGPISVVPASVPISLRETWCIAQTTTCPNICGGEEPPETNTCAASDLTYSCVCADVSTQPNISDYTQTLPFYECQQWVIDCVAAHPNDATGQHACQSVTCGSKNASENVASSASSTSSSSSSAPTSTSASSSVASTAASTTTGSTTSATASSAAIALAMGKQYGTGILAAGILAIFGFAL